MTRNEIFAVVRGNMETIIDGAKGQDIHETNSMRDYDADSLQIVEVVSRSMKQLRIKVRRTELSGARNLSDLLDLFERAASQVTVQ